MSTCCILSTVGGALKHTEQYRTSLPLRASSLGGDRRNRTYGSQEKTVQARMLQELEGIWAPGPPRGSVPGKTMTHSSQTHICPLSISYHSLCSRHLTPSAVIQSAMKWGREWGQWKSPWAEFQGLVSHCPSWKNLLLTHLPPLTQERSPFKEACLTTQDPHPQELRAGAVAA